MFANEEERSKVKICGLTSLEDARFVSGALAHYLGFIFYEESPRFVTPAEAGAIINWIEGPECVGVFVNQPLDDLNMIARQTGVDLVQLHGNESPEYCELVEKPVIKAIHVRKTNTSADLEDKIQPYLSVVDYLLFDTEVDGQWGGTGQSFDWSLLEEITSGMPFFLSGGLNPGNIREACKSVHPYAIDLSSGLESEPGVKDFDKVEQFMDEMRDIWEEQEMGTL
ncbi:MAG: phosphoribosylanthranilate isomerase [Balneolaceae bacterium]|nr:phosphoribosylanthranilate isomerase [Balneolaceae bacterium]